MTTDKDILAADIQQTVEVLSNLNVSADLPEASADYVIEHMRINPPVEPVFRVGEIGLGYDKDRDLVVLLAREIIMDNVEPEDAAVVRFWCMRDQARTLARWGMEVVQGGQPIEPEGHFCPKKNGDLH